ncbi:MAG TPA: NAD(+) diphosphatase [Geobacteraceae bacterium]|nr:NAD(+) diphosphatase [Geobacteraceae bacterium]
MRYPSTVNLPFNFDVIREGFRPLRPGDRAPGGPGWWLPIQGNSLLVLPEGEGFRLHHGEMPDWLEGGREPLCIGLWQGEPLYATAVSGKVQVPSPWQDEAFNAAEDRLDDLLLTLGGMGKQILYWQKESRFCSLCGEGLVPTMGSWGRRCSGCGHDHFPSIHPCSIVLVRRGEEFLFARKREWLPGRYSLVAGFLDFGESLEECAAREVLEETGILVENVRYVGSQCWPFPSQLMAGFIADYAGGEIRVDESELEDARWFSRSEPPAGFPSRRSIARWIIDRHMLGGKW